MLVQDDAARSAGEGAKETVVRVRVRRVRVKRVRVRVRVRYVRCSEYGGLWESDPGAPESWLRIRVRGRVRVRVRGRVRGGVRVRVRGKS